MTENAQATSGPATSGDGQRSLASDYGDRFLAAMFDEYRLHVEGLKTWHLEPSGRRALEWSPAGVKMPTLRKVQRQEHRGRASCFIVNYPGLISALPAKSLRRRPKKTGLSGIPDEQIAKELSIASAMRGRGLSDRAVTVVEEFLARCGTAKYWLCKNNAGRVPVMSRAELAMLTDVALTPIARGVLGMLRGARRSRRWGLVYTNAQIGLALGCDESTVRRAMRDLEDSGIAWRLVMWRPGVGPRPVDQDANVLIPGPQWMATVDAAVTGNDADRERLVQDGSTIHCKRRKIDADHKRFRRRMHKARHDGEPVPDPPGSVPLSFDAWWEAKALGETEIAAIREQIEGIERKFVRIEDDDARRLAAGELSVTQVLEREGDRERARAEIRATRATAMETTTAERLGAAPLDMRAADGPAVRAQAERAHKAGLSSSWAGKIPARSVPSRKNKEKEKPPTSFGRAAPVLRAAGPSKRTDKARPTAALTQVTPVANALRRAEHLLEYSDPARGPIGDASPVPTRTPPPPPPGRGQVLERSEGRSDPEREGESSSEIDAWVVDNEPPRRAESPPPKHPGAIGASDFDPWAEQRKALEENRRRRRRKNLDSDR